MPRTPILLLTAALLAGCVTIDETDLDGAVAPDDADLPLPRILDGLVHVDVPVPVVMIGYPEEAVAKLASTLVEEKVHHLAINLNQALPPDPNRDPEESVPLSGGTIPIPVVPTAKYRVQAAGADLEAALAERLDGWLLEGGDLPVYDARALEAFLEEALPGAGLAPDPDAPSVVLVHLEAFGVDVHTWRYDFPNGYLSPIRVFGERLPMLVMDFSATMNPQRSVLARVGDTATGNSPEPYGDRLGVDDLAAIEEHVREATHFRILQGSIYPIPLAECHAITLILAYRPTGIAEATGVMKGARELFDEEALRGAYENLTGATVYVDVKVLELPVDDPALDALSRGEFATFEVQRGWIAMNWDEYWVPHEGCEAYVSFVVQGDAASLPSGVVGIGTYDHARGYRISMSWVNEILRAAVDPASPVGVLGDPSGPYNWINYLFAHETGHILGMRHPHDTTRAGGGVGSTTYQDVWSAMSYSGDGRVIDFGAIDQANHQRNRAGYMLGAALAKNLGETEEFAAALAHLAANDWRAANDVLGPLVREETGAGADADALADAGSYLPHPGAFYAQVREGIVHNRVVDADA